ncbi:SGNH/GDSL hydrolase family protein [Streptomyces lycii]|nr:SGNH/GDSL hydrolase family protein [Streptomyces lycii]
MKRTSETGVSTLMTSTTGTQRRVLGLAALLLLTAACSGRTTTASREPGVPDAPPPGNPALSKVLLLGDSIAAGEALPLAAAFEAGGVEFESIASEGGGNVVGPFSEKNWKKLPGQIASAEPTLVVHQLTTYDWGTPQEQRAAYERLLTTVNRAGAELVFVTAPPIRPDDFYEPHLAELDRAPDVARAVAAGSPGPSDSSGPSDSPGSPGPSGSSGPLRQSDRAAGMLDARAVWGSTYQQVKDGRAYRSPDGVHTCPQGAAAFTKWLLGELARLFPGFSPAPAKDWADTGWSADKHFQSC